MGTVKYIDSKHYHVPVGKAAIELVSGAPSGILANTILTKDSTYKLQFTIGDANNSCIGDFIVYAQAGPVIQNFSVQSSGKGFTERFSMQFGAFSSLTPISFSSFNQSRTSENFSCGPVIDNIVLDFIQASSQIRQPSLAVSSLVFSLLLFIFA
ncbi:uncharacterized protein LOC124921922 [Impatiens glandulifera]|uniref:uncharacterized protein LOC124921922 n=1 Tax=Impatiens glandulifera TaxID=253017 RepID=UPI001FB0D462|nr:uncharacterized protein LOC124921922 [Impatiens glandulifera]